ncbi:MAG: hypothetical protein GXP62_17385, partial [Oligoflexia bacterium]|nr:hypothetical protein [Oligoflexia bacterium]
MQLAKILGLLSAAGLLSLGPLACVDKGIGSPGTGSPGTTGDGGATGDGGTAAPECSLDTDCTAWEICNDQACADGDRNNSVDEAEPALWDDSVDGYLNPVDDVDYYSLTAEGGEFVRIRTSHDYGDSGGDTVLTLRDSIGKVVTTSDDYPTGNTTSSADSTIYAYLSTAGQYTIQVQDQGTYYDNGKAVGSPDYVYTLSVESWSQHTTEPDDGAAPSLDLSIDTTNSYYATGVALEETGDVDAITITHGLSDVNLWVYGMLDLSGSDAEPSARLWSADEELFLEKDGISSGGYAAYPSLPAGSYTLELYDSAGRGGADTWFFVFPIIFDSGGTYPFESEDNDSIPTANALDMIESKTSSGSTYAYGEATGTMDFDGDQDWFQVPARPDAEL